MAYLFKKLIQNTTTAVNVPLNAAWQVNYKVLNHYILAISQSQTQENILREASCCLKDILNYQMAAFVLQTPDHIDAWIDQRLYQKPLRQVIGRDFGSSPNLQYHALREKVETGPEPPDFRDQDLISYSLMNAGGLVRIYVLPERERPLHQEEVLEVIVQAVGIAVNNYLSIKRLEDNLSLDPLTGCYNRGEFDRLVGHHIASAKRYARGFSLIMLDIDHFKQVNDTHGHQAGDRVLKAIATSVLGAIRDGDYLARYGGEEFVVVLPNTRMPRAIQLAKRLRQVIQSLTIPLPDGRKISKTASFGVATLRAQDDLHSLVKAADVALYQAKAAGRNRVMPDLHVVNVEVPYVAAYTGGKQPILSFP